MKNTILTNLIKSTSTIIKVIFGKNKEQVKEIKPAEDKNFAQKDKIIFQPNVVSTKSSIDFYSKKDKEEQKIISINIELNEVNLSVVDNLCRFFEIDRTEAIKRGLWLLSIARDLEINNQKLGVVCVDDNGLVIDLIPINII